MNGTFCNHREVIDGVEVRCVRKNGHGFYPKHKPHRFVPVEREDLQAVAEMRSTIRQVLSSRQGETA